MPTPSETSVEAPNIEDEATGAELRGYEIARKVIEYLPGKKQRTRWAECGKFKPNQYGWRQAREMAVKLQEAHPNEVYRIRALIAMEPPPAAELEQPLSEQDLAAAKLLGLTKE